MTSDFRRDVIRYGVIENRYISFLVSLLGEFPRATSPEVVIIHEDRQKTTSMVLFMTWLLRKMIGHALASPSVAVQDVSCSPCLACVYPDMPWIHAGVLESTTDS